MNNIYLGKQGTGKTSNLLEAAQNFIDNGITPIIVTISTEAGAKLLQKAEYYGFKWNKLEITSIEYAKSTIERVEKEGKPYKILIYQGEKILAKIVGTDNFDMSFNSEKFNFIIL